MKISPEAQAALKAHLNKGDVTAIGQVIGGVIQRKLTLEDWMNVVFDRQEGTEFVAPYDIIGKTAQRAVRGELPQTFMVGKRKVYVQEDRYTSSPEIDIVDLKRGDVIQVAEIINESKTGIQDEIDLVAYELMKENCKHGDTNFITIVDDGTLVSGTQFPAYQQKVRRELDNVMYLAEDTTRERKLKAILGRRINLGDIIDNGVVSQDNRAKAEFNTELVPGSYRGVPMVALSGVPNRTGNVAFPKNEIWAFGAGAAAYSIPTDLLVETLPQFAFRQRWELLTERAIVLWDKALLWRLYIINTTAGVVSNVVHASTTQLVLEVSKYADVATCIDDNLWVWLTSATDPGAGNGEAYTAAVSADGKYITLTFTSPIDAGSYTVSFDAGLEDIGGTAFTAGTLTFVV